MSFLPDGVDNPFRAPQARIGDRGGDPVEGDRAVDAEVIRRDHIRHEASIRALGILCYILAGFGGLGTVGLGVAGSGLVPLDPGGQANPANISPKMLQGLFLGMAVFYLAMTILYVFVGYGLRALQAWARWTVIVLTILFLLYILAVGLLVAITQPVAGLVVLAICGAIPGYLIYLMAAPRASMVFSAEYKDVIRETPHVRATTGPITKIILVCLVAAVIFLVIVSLASSG